MDNRQFQKFLCLYHHFKTSPPDSIDMNFEGISNHEIVDAHLIQDIATGQCGSAGCLVGHMPFVFPQEYTYYDCGKSYIEKKFSFVVHNKLNKEVVSDDCLMEAFGLSRSEAHHLFNCTYTKGEPAREIVLEEMKKVAGRYGHTILI